MVDDLWVFAMRFELAMDLNAIRAASGTKPPARLLFHIQDALFQSALAALLRARDRPGRQRASVPALLRLLESQEVRDALETRPWTALYPSSETATSAQLIERAVSDLEGAFEPIKAQGEALHRFRVCEVAHADPDRPEGAPWPTYREVEALITSTYEIRRLLKFMRFGALTDPAQMHRKIHEENRRHLARIEAALVRPLARGRADPGG